MATVDASIPLQYQPIDINAYNVGVQQGQKASANQMALLSGVMNLKEQQQNYQDEQTTTDVFKKYGNLKFSDPNDPNFDPMSDYNNQRILQALPPKKQLEYAQTLNKSAMAQVEMKKSFIGLQESERNQVLEKLDDHNNAMFDMKDKLDAASEIKDPTTQKNAVKMLNSKMMKDGTLTPVEIQQLGDPDAADFNFSKYQQAFTKRAESGTKAAQFYKTQQEHLKDTQEQQAQVDKEALANATKDLPEPTGTPEQQAQTLRDNAHQVLVNTHGSEEGRKYAKDLNDSADKLITEGLRAKTEAAKEQKATEIPMNPATYQKITSTVQTMDKSLDSLNRLQKASDTYFKNYPSSNIVGGKLESALATFHQSPSAKNMDFTQNQLLQLLNAAEIKGNLSAPRMKMIKESMPSRADGKDVWDSWIQSVEQQVQDQRDEAAGSLQGTKYQKLMPTERTGAPAQQPAAQPAAQPAGQRMPLPPQFKQMQPGPHVDKNGVHFTVNSDGTYQVTGTQ